MLASGVSDAFANLHILISWLAMFATLAITLIAAASPSTAGSRVGAVVAVGAWVTYTIGMEPYFGFTYFFTVQYDEDIEMRLSQYQAISCVWLVLSIGILATCIWLFRRRAAHNLATPEQPETNAAAEY